jgi:hypothetical protein
MELKELKGKVFSHFEDPESYPDPSEPLKHICASNLDLVFEDGTRLTLRAEAYGQGDVTIEN